MSGITERMPPQALDMEEVVLGAILLQKDALGRVMDILQPEMFYSQKNAIIYRTAVELFTKGEPIDLMTMKAALSANGELKQAGGAFYIAQLTSLVSSAANIEYHSRVLVEKYIRRRLVEVSATTADKAYEDANDIFDLLDEVEQQFFSLSDGAVRKNYATLAQLYTEQMQRIDALCARKDGLTGLSTGYPSLDAWTAGWQATDLVIIAARPAMGKSAVMLNLAMGLANQGEGVAIFSLEMSSAQLMDRITCLTLQLASDKLKRGQLDEHDIKQMLKVGAQLTKTPVYIDDTPGISILDLRAKCRRIKAEKGIKMVIIDYLQLVKGAAGKGNNREQEIAHISRSLKEMAKELEVTVVALSQLSRAVESRGGDKRPQLSDLRESGAIEQDADMVVFLHRPEYYGIEVDEDGNSTDGLLNYIIAKYRNGATGTLAYDFMSWCGKVCERGGGFALLAETTANPLPQVLTQVPF